MLNLVFIYVIMSAIVHFSTHKYSLNLQSRQQAVGFLVSENIVANDFLEVIYQADSKQKIVLFHVLDLMLEKHPDYLNTSLNLYLKKALNETHESLKRCISRTIYHQLKNNKNLYNKEQKQQIVQTMFDWIILPSAVATRVNAIHILYFLVDEEDWIKEQLIALIEQNLLLQEPSFVSRGKKILKLLAQRKS